MTLSLLGWEKTTFRTQEVRNQKLSIKIIIEKRDLTLIKETHRRVHRILNKCHRTMTK